MIDASSVRESSCMRRFFWTVVGGYREKIPSNDMVFGSAFHKFAEVLEATGGNLAASLLEAKAIYQPENYKMKSKKQYMNDVYLIKVCMDFYLKEWIPAQENLTGFHVLKLNGAPLVEKKFALPFYTCDQFDILLCGTIDKLGRIGTSGVYSIADYKTTSSWDKEEYFNSYLLDPQFNVYSLVIHKLAVQFPTSLFAEMVAGRLSYFIEGIFLKSDGVTFQRSDVMHVKKERLMVFEAMLNKLVARLATEITVWLAAGEPDDTTYIPSEGELNGACKTVYGSCKFFNACAAPDSVATGHVLRNNYKREQYNPLLFGSVTTKK